MDAFRRCCRWAVVSLWLGFGVLAALPALAAEPPPVSPSAPASINRRVLAAQPGDTMTFAVGADVTVARVDRDGLWSGRVVLRRSGSGLEGHVGTEGIRLVFGPGRVTGQIGGSPIALDVVRASGVLQVMGRLGEREIALEFGPRVVGGEVGPCFYDLRLRANEYEGDVNCGGPTESVRLQVPVALVARDDVELAGMLATVLAR